MEFHNPTDVQSVPSVDALHVVNKKHKEEEMGLDFIKWYDIIMKDCPKKTEVKWYTL